ncbi:Lrp/AsnC family transcriptional regulator [Chloroflexota bacterium]
MDKKLDELDMKLLSELESKGFQKSASLAHRFDVGERTVRRRINDMKDSGIIKIIGIPNPVLLGYRAWAKIGIKVKSGYSGDVGHELVGHPSIYFVAYALGTFDIIIAVYFDTIERLTHFVNSELTNVKGILSTETMMLAYPRKYYNFSWPSPVSDKAESTRGYSPDTITRPDRYEIDEIDQKILNNLKEDGLIRPASLKSKLGTGENAIRKRLKNMLNMEVFKIAVVPNPEVMEYEVWATMGITIHHQSAHKVIDDIIRHPTVYMASLSLGRFNLVIATRFQNIDLLNKFIKIELPAIEGISSVEAFLHNKPLKYHNIDWSHVIKHGEKRPIEA